MEEEKSPAGCLANHGAQIVSLSSFTKLHCRMCDQDKEGGYKCTVCSDSFYCNDCRKLHLDARIEDGDGESAIDGDLNDTMSVTQS